MYLKTDKRTATYTAHGGQISGNSIQTSLCDSEGNLWFGIYEGGIMFYETGKGSFRQIFPDKLRDTDVRTLVEDSDGQIWAGTSNGIYRIEKHTQTITEHFDLPNNLVRSLLKDREGRMWIGTFGGGLLLYSPDMKPLRTFDRFNGFPSNTINHIIEDSRQNIWIATGDGLVKFACQPNRTTRFTDGQKDSPTPTFRQWPKTIWETYG